MKINADFTQQALVHNINQEWVPSPMRGVDRKPLDRVGGEVARATSIVRYAPKSRFSAHVHSGGEEFVVLEGVFQDEHGDYPAGSYVRNPPQSKHTPSSEQGCVIFVKLWQFQPDDRKHINVVMKQVEAAESKNQKGVVQRVLFADKHEKVMHISLLPDVEWCSENANGNEILVLEGSLKHKTTTLTKHDWLRVPVAQKLTISAGSAGATIWLKSGNLPDIQNQINRVKNA